MKNLLLFLWRIVRLLLRGFFVLAGALALLVGASFLLDIPGCNRYRRYCSYESKDALVAAEMQDMRFYADCTVNGTNFTIVAMRDCRFLASGLAVLVYDANGKLFDKTREEGDDGRFQQRWGNVWRKAVTEDTNRWLHEARMPKGKIDGLTMPEFAAFMEKESKLFSSEWNFACVSDELRRMRGVRFRCSELAPVRKVVERQKMLGPIEIGGATFWDVLTNACQQAGYAFEIRPNHVWIHKPSVDGRR